MGWFGRSVLLLMALVASSSTVRPQELAPDPRPLLEQGAYERAEDAARSQVDAARRLHGDHALAIAVASDVLVRALVLNGKGGAPSTREIAEQTLRDKKRTVGPGTPISCPPC